MPIIGYKISITRRKMVMIAVRKKAQIEDDIVAQEVVASTFSLKELINESVESVEEPRISKKVTPLDEEIILDPKKYILSKTDTKGIIEYGNDYFVEISGYEEEELVGKNHNIIRHPDMPKVVFQLLWKRISNRENIIAVVKNMAKDGRYYWVVTDFEIKIDKVTNEITGYFAYRTAAPRKAIETMEPLYKKLLSIEKNSGIDGSGKYLNALLETENKTYDQFINEVTGKNSTMMRLLFAAMKKFFR